MTKLTSDFGARVKELRERLHLTQEAMAESLGVSFATVNRWENGWTGAVEIGSAPNRSAFVRKPS